VASRLSAWRQVDACSHCRSILPAAALGLLGGRCGGPSSSYEALTTLWPQTRDPPCWRRDGTLIERSRSVLTERRRQRARAVLAEDRFLRLTPHEGNQMEQALDSEPEVVPQFKAFIRRISEDSEAVSS
jgi:hypothetical protein